MPWASHLPRPATAVPFALAIATFVATYEQGSFGTGIWTAEAALVWWCVLLGLLLSPRPRGAIPRAGAATAILLVAFAAFSGLSAVWASGAEAPVIALARALFYAGIVVAALRFATLADLPALCDGIGAGLVAIELLALATRFFSRAFAPAVTAPAIFDAHTRLSYPVGYWNGLAVVAALSCPLVLRRATAGGRRDALALLVFPPAIIVAYLASSRTGAIAIAIGTVAFVAFARRREALAAALAGVAPSLVAVALISRLGAIVEGPLRTGSAASAGRWAALAVIAAGSAAAALYPPVLRVLGRLARTRMNGRIGVTGIAAVAVVAVALAHPVRRWDSFTHSPPAFAHTGYVQSHFLSANGNWRYQFWHAAVDEFRTRPIGGRGAGSFTAWWDQHGPGFVANPHSLYFETLGDLGLVGFALLAAALVVGAVAAVRRLAGLDRRSRGAVAAALASFVAWAVAAGVDWLWELPAVTGVAVLLLGLALAPAEPSAAVRPVPRWQVAGAAVAVLAVLLLELDLKAGDWLYHSSQAAAGRGALSQALKDAQSSRDLQPWAASPQLQVALVQEAAGRLAQAEASIDAAIRLERRDWRLYYVLARIERRRGEPTTGSEQWVLLLNPHAPITRAG